MKTIAYVPLATAISVALTACGGGGGGGGGLAGASGAGYTLQGTVPGTLIEAFCDDGSYYLTASENNDTVQHPFSLNLPADVACRIVMITNEDDPNNRVITPLALRKQDGQSGIAITTSAEVIDLGHVNLAMSRATMFSDGNADGVEDIPREVALDDDESRKVEINNSGNDPMDKDGDGIIEVYEDDDSDGVPNQYDPDDDDDGILDLYDNDHDNDGHPEDDLDRDGVTNDIDVDDDNDGVEDEADSDDDNDGVSDELDSDDDNDGTRDEDEDDENLDEDSDEESGDDDGSGGFIPVEPGEATPGRLLASQCAQCHGSDGRSVSDIDSLVGEGDEIRSEMIEMKNSTNRDDIMHKQAAGYTDIQIQQISDHFATIPGGEE